MEDEEIFEYLDAWAKGTIDPPPICGTLGIELVEFSEDDRTATTAMSVTESHHNALGTLHGGVYCDLADVAMGVVAALLTSGDETFTTLDMQTQYFEAVESGRLLARASVVRKGSRTIHLECDIVDEDGNEKARTRSTYVILSDG